MKGAKRVTAGLIDPDGCHAYDRDLGCDHIGDRAYHGLVNVDVAQAQGCGDNPNVGDGGLLPPTMPPLR
jgi:hypothetical protein